MVLKRENRETRSNQLVTKRAHEEHPAKMGSTGVQRTGPINHPTARENRGLGFFSFRYSFKEVSLSGDKTHIRAKEHRFEDGKFQSEEFEGTMDASVYQDALRQTQGQVAGQVRAVMNLLSSFFPFSSRSKEK